MEVTGFNMMTQTDDPELGKSHENMPESTLNLHNTTQKNEDSKGQQIPGSNNFKFSHEVKIGNRNNKIFTLSNQKSATGTVALDGSKDIKVNS